MEYEDIGQSREWDDIEYINKGWSDDKKYKIKTRENEELLLKISDIGQFAKKKKEFEIIILGCSNTDFDDEYPATEPVQLINGDRVNKEYLKCNAFDFISILIRNAKGQVYTILEMELC